MAILIGQDLVALIALALLPLFAATPVAEGELGPAVKFGIMVLALPVIFFGARYLLPRTFQRAAIARNQEAFGLCSIAGCLVVALAAREVGASMPLGAFLGGLIFAGTPYAHQIRADLAVFKNLALGFFFVTVGLLLDLPFAFAHIGFLLAALVAVIAGKTVITLSVIRAFRAPATVAAGAGLALSQVGEFALVLTGIARPAGLLGDEGYQLLISLTALTMLVAPVLVAKSLPFGRWFGVVVRRGRRGAPPPPLADAPLSAGSVPGAPSPHSPAFVSSTDENEVGAPAHPVVRAIVVGYGPVGKTLCRILIRSGVEPSVIDLSLETIRKLRAIGREGIYGDAGRREVLNAAGILEARYLLITLPDFASRSPIITSARALNPRITIVSRSRYLAERDALLRSGADQIATEECEVAVEMARLLLRRLDVPEAIFDDEIARARSEITQRSGFTTMMRRPFGDASEPPPP